MSELFEILDRYRIERAKGTRVVHLATLLATEGSTYRRPGARSLFVADGSERGYATVGLVSGGCVEGDLAHRRVDADGIVVHAYDLDEDGDALFGLGLGCRGKLRIALERIVVGAPNDPLARLEEWLARADGPGYLAHDLEGTAPPRWSPTEEEARRSWPESAFVERLPRRIEIAIFGAGPDVVPLLALVRTMGWEAKVIDHRRALLAELPVATRACPLERLDDAAASVDADAAIVMTHAHDADARVLAGLALATARSPRLRYAGLLGPRRRRDELLAETANVRGARLDAILHGPAGLDLGGDGAEAVALSIVAEIHATLHRRSGARLREKAGAIHDATPPRVHGVVLAAGESRRFGGAKALATLGGETLLARAVGALRATDGIAEVAVVVGARADRVGDAARSLGARVVENARWEIGMTSSLRVAVDDAIAGGAEALVVVAVDQPALNGAHLSALVAEHRKGHPIVASAYQQTIGIPAIFDRSMFAELARLPDDGRGKDVLHRNRDRVVSVAFAGGESDVDTRDDLTRHATALGEVTA